MTGRDAQERAALKERRDSRTTVLYIAGWGRSGSTILGNVLNEVESLFHVGEIMYVWENGLIRNWLCGSGVPFRESEVWRRIFNQAFGGVDQVEPDEMCRLRDTYTRNRRVVYNLLAPESVRVPATCPLLCETLARLYAAIIRATGAEIVVDSSKSPMYAYLLSEIAGIDLHIVHLVRDARATAFSWSKKVARSDLAKDVKTYQEQFGAQEGSVKWLLWNVMIHLIRKRKQNLFLRYEDFVSNPRAQVRRILRLVNAQSRPLPFLSSHEVELGTNHTVWGNPNRMQSGLVKIRANDEWRKKMEMGDWSLVTSLTWPLLLKYGYLRPKKISGVEATS